MALYVLLGFSSNKFDEKGRFSVDLCMKLDAYFSAKFDEKGRFSLIFTKARQTD